MRNSDRLSLTAARLPITALIALLSLAITHPAHGQVCPFDDGNSSLAVEGLILTRYALGITGAPLVTSTGINAVNAPSVEATINCPSCGLNITGNPTMTVADATIISRKLAGFSGAALTDNLALGSGTRNTPAAVNSFLLAGCGATGGTVTSITAGTGLTGGIITGSGTIAADTTFLQRRVTSTCTAGSFITAVAADGTVTCGTPPAGGSGTVTSVSAGTGLTGGTFTTTGTIAADTTFLQRRVALPCAAGSFITAIAADGSATCGVPPAGGSGTVTSVTAGTGLTGGTISTSGTVAADTTFLQRRVSATCAVGSSIRAIAADGTVTCQTDSTGGSGTVTSVSAGTGLTGGTFTTAGTIAADTAFLQRRVALPCAAGSFITAIAADGTATCGTPPAGGSGTVTSVATGAGLTGGPISTTGTINLATTQLLPTVACAPTQIAKWSGFAWACANDATVTNAWVQGGNAFGAPGVIGTTDAQPLTVRSGGSSVGLLMANGHGLRIEDKSVAAVLGVINVINGVDINSVAAAASGATIGGGGYRDLLNPGASSPNQVLGGFGTVSGGYGNTASGERSTIGGGTGNTALGLRSTVGGGDRNVASGTSSTISGGRTNEATNDDSTVAGGHSNTATGVVSAVGGGLLNTASGYAASVGGGLQNTSSNLYASVGGGYDNTASGLSSVVSGGRSNTAAGEYSWAAGRRAKAGYTGAFLWADSTDLDFKVQDTEFTGAGAGWTSAVNTFNARATGGVWFVTAVNGTTGRPTAGAFLASGSGTWASTSDRAAKTAIAPINAQDILRKVAALPISSWQYLTENGVRHIGPMSQDFKRLFAVGRDERSITTVDADGVALAAIQGLNQIVKAKDAKIAALEKANAAMLRDLAAIKKKLGM